MEKLINMRLAAPVLTPEEDPAKRSNWTNDAFEHTSPFGDEKNIKINKI